MFGESVLRACVSALALAASASSVGCSVVLDADQVQCNSDADCAASGLGNRCAAHVCEGPTGDAGTPDGGGGSGGTAVDRWACLGNVTWPMPNPGEIVDVNVATRMATGGPIPDGITVKYCAALDPDCTAPLAGPTPLDSTGKISVQTESGTRGFFEFTGTPIMPNLLYFSQPAFGAASGSNLDEPVTLVSPDLFDTLIDKAGEVADPTRGTLLTVTIDCNAEPAVGVRIESALADAQSKTFYFVGLLPSPTATQTDVQGYGGILNVPPGTETVESYVVETGALIGSSGYQIRAGTLTSVAVEPTPM